MFIERITTDQGIQSNTITAVIEDTDNYYIISGSGLDVVTKVTKNRTAWITRGGGYTAIAQDNSYLYLGTSDEGIYSILKLNLSGNSASSASIFLDNSDPPGSEPAGGRPRLSAPGIGSLGTARHCGPRSTAAGRVRPSVDDVGPRATSDPGRLHPIGRRIRFWREH